MSTGREEALRFAIYTLTSRIENEGLSWLFGELAGDENEDDLSLEDEQMLNEVAESLVSKLKSI